MKLHSAYIAILAILTSAPLGTAGTVKIGADITVSDLAKHLGVQTFSMIYRQDEPFSKLSIHLVYKERSDAGKLEEKKSLINTTYALPINKKEKETPIKILFSRDKSTIIAGSTWSISGEGLDITDASTINKLPERLEDGAFVLVKVYDSTNPNFGNDESIKGILQLIVSPSE